MNEPKRDWEKELADIDRAIARQQGAPASGPTPPAPAPPAPTPPAPTPPAPTPPAPTGPAPRPASLPSPPRPSARQPELRTEGAVGRGAVAFTWLRVGLAAVLGLALALWPYPKTCGLQLFFFLAAAAATFLVAGWAAVGSWSSRRGVAHLLALAVLGWAGVVAGAEVLPRIGYARLSLPWTCDAAPPATQPSPQR